MKTQPIKTFAEAQKFLLTLPRSRGAAFQGAAGFERSRQFYELLGNPQDSFKSIHIAGTSGKGSTAYVTSALLQAAGKKVGLHVTPHIHDVRERMMINGEYISEAEFCQHLNSLLLYLDGLKPDQMPTYYEFTLGMAFMTFKRHNVDYAVLETGLGGLYDSTNTVTRPDKLAVITQIGLDHTNILGDTITAIAEQKAGIIQPKIKVLALDQEAEVTDVFKQAAKAKQAELELFEPGKHVQHIHSTANGTTFNLKLKPWIWRELKLGLIGRHQAINAGMALRAVQILAERDGFELAEADARKTLDEVRVPARFEMRQVGSKTVIIDGAHNLQKLAGLLSSLKELYPGRKFSFVMSLLDTRHADEIIDLLSPVTSRVFTFGFVNDVQALSRTSHTAQSLAKLFADKNVAAKAYETTDLALAAALNGPDDILVVTGSFYFADEVYKELPS